MAVKESQNDRTDLDEEYSRRRPVASVIEVRKHYSMHSFHGAALDIAVA